MRHSGAYHRHFEGYIEEKYRDSQGRERIRRVYAAPYYRQDLTRAARIRLRFLYVLLTGGGIAAFIRGAISPLVSNMNWIVVLMECTSGLLIAWCVLSLILYLFAPRQMTVGEFRETGVRLKTAAKRCMNALWLLAAGMIIAAFLLDRENLIRGIVSAFLFGISGCCFLLIFLKESAVVYLKSENRFNEMNTEGFRII